MRKGVFLTPRDGTLMKHLSYGLSTFSNIFKNFFSKENANEKTRQRVAMRRLQKLEAGGFIRSVTYPTFDEKLYTLTKEAAPIVASRYGLELHNIWVSFNEKHLEHDYFVSSITRKIIKEAKEEELYELRYLLLEICLRKDGGKVRRGIHFPDIIFEIISPRKLLTLSVEVDCGTVSRKDFIGKMKHFKDNIIVITHCQARMELLKRYVREERIMKAVYFGVFRDFLAAASLLDYEWRMIFMDKPTTLRSRFFS